MARVQLTCIWIRIPGEPATRTPRKLKPSQQGVERVCILDGPLQRQIGYMRTITPCLGCGNIAYDVFILHSLLTVEAYVVHQCTEFIRGLKWTQ
jgi:hypothetical protein